MAKLYFGPWTVYLAWISIVTHLHHTHPGTLIPDFTSLARYRTDLSVDIILDIPWYNSASWAYLRGALSTVDRNYGFIEPIHHNIGTHVVHHIFSKIPHYNLLKASARIEYVSRNLRNKLCSSDF
jgi:acyl-lipid omega-3 desaturase